MRKSSNICKNLSVFSNENSENNAFEHEGRTFKDLTPLFLDSERNDAGISGNDEELTVNFN